jgi:hypothetical protein
LEVEPRACDVSPAGGGQGGQAMTTRASLRLAGRWLGCAAGLGAGAYAAYAGVTWLRYGRAARPSRREEDLLLDRFMPAYDVVDRHHVQVAAPPAKALDVARNLNLEETGVVRAIFKARALLLGARPAPALMPRGLLDEVQSLGWVVLAEEPGRQLVVGAVTRPWEPDVTFRSIPPDAFGAFSEPDYVKIAWTLRAEPSGQGTLFLTETRALATDAAARTKFRRYWSLLSPGIILIRRVMLRSVKAGAERQAPARAA